MQCRRPVAEQMCCALALTCCGEEAEHGPTSKTIVADITKFDA